MLCGGSNTPSAIGSLPGSRAGLGRGCKYCCEPVPALQLAIEQAQQRQQSLIKCRQKWSLDRPGVPCSWTVTVHWSWAERRAEPTCVQLMLPVLPRHWSALPAAAPACMHSSPGLLAQRPAAGGLAPAQRRWALSRACDQRRVVRAAQGTASPLSWHSRPGARTPGTAGTPSPWACAAGKAAS